MIPSVINKYFIFLLFSSTDRQYDPPIPITSRISASIREVNKGLLHRCSNPCLFATDLSAHPAQPTPDRCKPHPNAINYALAIYSPVLVSMRILSSWFTNRGT